METKVCPNCGGTKPKSSFGRRSYSKHVLRSWCKECDKSQCKEYAKTIKGLAHRIFTAQKRRSILRGHPSPTYTLKEFIKWMVAAPSFANIYEEWLNSGCQKLLTPSADRLDDYKGYSFDNLRLVTWGENDRKAAEDVKMGRNNKRSKAVMQYSKKGELIAEYWSVMEADRQTSADFRNISKCCHGRIPSLINCIWKFKADVESERKSIED